MPHATLPMQMALCLYKLGRPLEALRLAEPAVASWCLQDAQRFQLRGLIKHDLKRFGEAVKVRRLVAFIPRRLLTGLPANRTGLRPVGRV